MHSSLSTSQMHSGSTLPDNASKQATFVDQVATNLLALVKRVVLQYRIRQERNQLSALPDHLLKDIGISRVDALQESCRSWSDIPEHRKNE